MRDMKRAVPPPVTLSGRLQRLLAVPVLGAAAVAFALLEGCGIYRPYSISTDGMRQRTVMMEVTGYDSGERSCNWTRDRNGNPVIASGPNKGQPKAVGITASASFPCSNDCATSSCPGRKES